MKKSIKYILKLIVGLIILVILFSKIGINEIVNSFSKTNPIFLILAILTFIIALFAAISNVHIMIRGLCKPIPFLKTIKYYLLSWSAGLLMPGKIGDFSIIYFLKKENIPIGKGTAVSIADKLITITTILILGSFGFFLFFEIEQAIYFMILFVGIALIGFFLIMNKYPRLFLKRILGKKAEMFKGFSKSMIHYVKTKKNLLMLNLAITMFQWIMSSVSVFFAFKAFGVSIPILTILLITAVVTLFALIPLTMSGLGIKESVAVFLYASLVITL